MSPLFELRWRLALNGAGRTLQFRQKGEMGEWSDWEDVPEEESEDE